MKRLKPAGAYVRGLLSLKQIGTICFAFLFSVFSTNLFATGISANATSASCDNPTLGTYSGTSNLQANWQSNKIDLYWYSDNAQITNVQSAATSCNYDGTLNVPSSTPTKTGYTFNGWKVRGVPAGYTRLQYIQTTGTQYIRFSFPTASNIDVSTNLLHTDGTNEQIFFAPSSNIQFLYTVSSGWRLWKSGVAGINLGALGTQHTFVIKTTTSGVEYYVDGVKNTSVNSNLFTSSAFSGQSLNIGARTTSGGADYFWKGKIYSFDVICDGVLRRNLVPVKRNSDSVIGMYDIVNGTFFTNAGSGTFTAGPAVQ